MSMSDPQHKPESSQVEKFRDLARKLETDDDEARFNERVKKLAKAAPQPKTSKTQPPDQ
jgi:hypothetical protein